MMNWLERLGFYMMESAAFMFLVAALLEEFLCRVETTIDGLARVADRLGDLGVAWWRLMTAIRRAGARWRRGDPDDAA